MAVTSLPATRPGTVLTLSRFDAEDGELVIEGAWEGVRGLRFLRPTLLVGDRPVLASLADKPWAADAATWRASFPWEGHVPDPAEVTLVVAPSLAVRLDGSTPAVPEVVLAARPPEVDVPPRREAPPSSGPPAAPQAAAAGPDVARLAEERDALRAERDALRAAVARLQAAVARSGGDDRDAAAAAERDRGRAIAERDEARADRDAVLRARAHEEARRRAAQVERLRAERDEARLADEASRRQASDAAADPPPAAGAEAPDAPLGVREVPARPGAPSRSRDHARDRPAMSGLDRWALRLGGTIATACFLALLVLFVMALL